MEMLKIPQCVEHQYQRVGATFNLYEYIFQRLDKSICVKF
jgi:hypothetical protein